MTSLEFLFLSDNFISGTIPGNLTYIPMISLYNTSIVRDSIPNSYDSVIVEPCIICDGEGNFDLVESIDENRISSAEECSTSVNNINNDFPFVMSTINECSLLREECVICHKDNNKSDHTSYQTSSIGSTSTNSGNNKRNFVSINNIP